MFCVYRLAQIIANYIVDEIIIDKSAKRGILADLYLMNVHTDTIYPDLERTAIYLRNKKLGWKGLTE